MATTAAWIMGSCMAASATTLTVTNNNDAGAGSLRAQVAAATSGDTIDFDAGVTGTITLTTGEVLIDKSLTIAGPGSGVLNVSGNDASRIFHVISAVTVSISDLTLRDGANDFGAAVENGGTLTLTDCVLRENSATFSGGAIRNGGPLTIVDCAFVDNTAVQGGGAIESGGTLQISNTLFDGNAANGVSGDAGALWLQGGTYTISGSQFVDNHSTQGAGAIRCQDGSVTIDETSFTGNFSTNGAGGAIFISSAPSVTITDSTFDDNTAFAGGAISTGGATVIDRCTFTNNHSDGAVVGHSFTMRNSTITGNTGSQIGGLAVYNDVTIRNCTIADNVATNAFGPAPNIFIGANGTKDIQNTLVAGGSPVNCVVECGATIVSRHNLDTGTSCQFTGTGDIQNGTAGLGPLANNGGPTQTRALLGNSHGNNAGNPVTCPAIDQRGVTRPIGPACDIGAFEGPCGDGVSDPGEACDDANAVNGDGCDVNCSVTACGNHVVSPGEDCEDGNSGVNGGCCDGACQYEGSGSPCVGAGSPCDGEYLCSANSQCNGSGSCEIAIRTGCRSAQKTGLSFKHPAGEEFKDKLRWKWSKGEATDVNEFGDPATMATDYALCVFAGSSFITSFDVPANNTLWSAAGSSGFKYKDRTAASDGVMKIKLKAGAADKAKAKLTAKGANMPGLPAGPLPLPVTAQLVNSANNVCYDSSFDSADVRYNLAEKFKARTK